MWAEQEERAKGNRERIDRVNAETVQKQMYRKGVKHGKLYPEAIPSATSTPPFFCSKTAGLTCDATRAFASCPLPLSLVSPRHITTPLCSTARVHLNFPTKASYTSSNALLRSSSGEFVDVPPRKLLRLHNGTSNSGHQGGWY